MTSFDTIVIGGGHNGLVSAAFLARSGRKVLVLEADAETGGAGCTHAFAPGFRVSTAHVLNRLHPDVVKGLDLQGHGLNFSPVRQIPSVALSADGKPLILGGAYGEVLEGAGTPEQRAWAEVRAQLFRYAGILKPLLSRRPPALGGYRLLRCLGAGPDRPVPAKAWQGGHAGLPARAADECRGFLRGTAFR